MLNKLKYELVSEAIKLKQYAKARNFETSIFTVLLQDTKRKLPSEAVGL